MPPRQAAGLRGRFPSSRCGVLVSVTAVVSHHSLAEDRKPAATSTRHTALSTLALRAALSGLVNVTRIERIGESVPMALNPGPRRSDAASP